jgi:hypothetical protein
MPALSGIIIGFRGLTSSLKQSKAISHSCSVFQISLIYEVYYMTLGTMMMTIRIIVPRFRGAILSERLETLVELSLSEEPALASGSSKPVAQNSASFSLGNDGA